MHLGSYTNRDLGTAVKVEETAVKVEEMVTIVVELGNSTAVADNVEESSQDCWSSQPQPVCAYFLTMAVVLKTNLLFLVAFHY